MGKTIKELADELGVSKQSVQYHCKFLPTKDIVKNDKKATKNIEEATKENKIELSFYKNQLEEKDKLIKELINSQKNLQKLLDQQQVLTLQANQKIEQLELQQEEKVSDVSEEIQTLKKKLSKTKEEVKKSFWQRLFGN